MEKIEQEHETEILWGLGSVGEMIQRNWDKINEIIDHINKQEHSLDWIEEAQKKAKERFKAGGGSGRGEVTP